MAYGVLGSLNILSTIGNPPEIFKEFVVIIEQFSIATEFMLLVATTLSKYRSDSLRNGSDKNNAYIKCILTDI